MFPLVVVIDFPKAADDGGNLAQLFHRDGHGSQCAGAQPLGLEYRSHPADESLIPELLQNIQHQCLTGAQLLGNVRIGRCGEGKPFWYSFSRRFSSVDSSGSISVVMLGYFLTAGVAMVTVLSCGHDR